MTTQATDITAKIELIMDSCAYGCNKQFTDKGKAVKKIAAFIESEMKHPFEEEIKVEYY